MDTLITLLRIVHIVAGFTSLLVFWIPVIVQKGGKAHRLSGKAYVVLMWIVSSTAAVLSVKNALIGEMKMAAFLGFIALITAHALWCGVAVLKNKKKPSKTYRLGRIAFSGTIIAAGLGLIIYGISLRAEGAAVLLFIFGGLGLTELPSFINRLRRPEHRMPWLKEHIVAICSSGIAAYTAFFVFGASQFFNSVLPGYWAVIPWIAPGLIGTFGIRYAVKRFARS